MTLDELRQIDFKDLPELPLSVQLGTLLAMVGLIFALAYYAVFSDISNQISAAEKQEEQLKTSFLDKKRQVADLVALEQQLKEIEAAFSVLLKQLPTKAEMASLLTEINQAGVGRGLLFELFRPGSEVKTEQIATLPIQIKVSGSFTDLVSFVSDVSLLSRIVTIGDMTLTPNKDGLLLQATAKTYRALEAHEQAAKAGK